MKTIGKKISVFTMAMLFVLSLSACGNAGSQDVFQSTQQVSSQSVIQDTDISGSPSTERIEITDFDILTA